MDIKYYYVDTSIWLNLFKKEGDATKGVPYWKIAEDFLERISLSKDKEIIYSDIVMREMYLVAEEQIYLQFQKVVNEGCLKVNVLREDKKEARKLESAYNYTISFYDLLHMCIARRVGATIITRDKYLIQICRKNNVQAMKPEETGIL